jgi:hypothetical protein
MPIKELQDVNGNVIHPETEMAAIVDADKLVNTTSTQNNIAGIKNFVDGISIKGVQLSPDSINFGNTKSIPNNNIYDINQSGLYYYNEKTINLPVMNHENISGYIVASFVDADDGILLFVGSLTTMEKYQSKWRTDKTNTPITLWMGQAKVGDSLKLASNINNFDRLRFKIWTPLANDYIERSTNSTRFWLTQVGLDTGDGGTVRVVDLTLDRTDNPNELKISKAIINEGGNKVSNISDSVITIIEGLK